MSDTDFYTVLFGLFAVGLIVFGIAVLQIRDRQRWHAQNAAEERATKAVATPAE